MSIADGLQRREGGTFTAEQMGWIAMFDSQRTDYANKIADARRRHELVIAELESRLRDAKAAKEKELAAVRQKHIPWGEYVPLEDFEFKQRCWTEYLNACLLKKALSAPKSEENAADAVEVFGDVVKQRHLLDFIMQDERQNQLQNYVNTKIRQLENVWDERSAKRFRGLLATVGHDPPPAQTPTRVATDPRADANRIFNIRFVDPGEPIHIPAQDPRA